MPLEGLRAETQPLIERILDVCLDENRETSPLMVGLVSAEPIILNPRAASRIRAKREPGAARSDRAAVSSRPASIEMAV